MSTSAPWRTGAARSAAATPLAATTASVQLATGWGKMENPVKVMPCAICAFTAIKESADLGWGRKFGFFVEPAEECVLRVVESLGLLISGL